MSESGNGGCRGRRFVRKECVMCGKRRGDRLLDCVEPECPMAFHVKCFPLELNSDGSRSFLCPYCSFKAATLRADDLKKKAILAKQAMLRFIGATTGKEGPGQNDSSASKNGNQGDDAVPPKVTGAAPADFVAGTGVSGHSKEAQRHDDTSASKDGNQGNDVVPPKVTGAPAEEGPCIEKEMAGAERSSPPKQPAKRKAAGPIVKRKRLNWRDEEVEMLEEGVRKFSEENKYLPWKRILEFGAGTFDSTRAPIDLQNKWKNLQKRNTKESGHND